MITILPTVYQNKTTVSGKVAGFGVQLQGEISGTKCSRTIWTKVLTELFNVLW